MVKTVGCSGLPTCDNRLGPGNGGGRTNVKPQPLMRDPVETSLLYRPVPEDIGGESVSRRIPQQAWRDELDARTDERRKKTGAAPRTAARIVPVEVTRSPLTMPPGRRKGRKSVEMEKRVSGRLNIG